MTRQTRASRRPPLLGGVVVVLLLGLFVGAAFAAEPIIITSASRQFIVRGLPQRSALAASAKDDFAYLDPAILAVTCERVRQTLIKELGWGDRWRGTIYVNIHSVRGVQDRPDILAFRTDRGWAYRLDVPDEIGRTRLLETIVEALLLEFADRAAREESVELPPWLVEGLTAHLAQGPLAGVVLQARSLRQLAEEPELRAPRTIRHVDVDQLLRQKVQASGALTVDQLNWADFDDRNENSAEAYHFSAHLFVRELLRLRGGPDALCATLALLPEHLNWQTAFLRGFEPHFKRMLDVEKWWSLTVAQMKSRDSSLQWSAVEAHGKLEEILYTPMEVRLAADELPHVTPVALQTVLNDWDYEQQQPLLQAKLQQLQLTRLRLPPELLALADGYRLALGKYLQARGEPGRAARERKIQTAVAQTIAQLNALDEQRNRLASKALADQPARPGTRGLSVWSEPRPGLAAPAPGR